MHILSVFLVGFFSNYLINPKNKKPPKMVNKEQKLPNFVLKLLIQEPRSHCLGKIATKISLCPT